MTKTQIIDRFNETYELEAVATEDRETGRVIAVTVYGTARKGVEIMRVAGRRRIQNYGETAEVAAAAKSLATSLHW